MVVLDEDFGTGLTLVEGNGGVRLSPVSVPERAPRDWRSQCEQPRLFEPVVKYRNAPRGEMTRYLFNVVSLLSGKR